MSDGKQVDPTETYVLEETSITRLNSLEELAELALRRSEESRSSTDARGRETPKDGRGEGEARAARDRVR